jgi:hypothetical protein
MFHSPCPDPPAEFLVLFIVPLKEFDREECRWQVKEAANGRLLINRRALMKCKDLPGR